MRKPTPNWDDWDRVGSAPGVHRGITDIDVIARHRRDRKAKAYTYHGGVRSGELVIWLDRVIGKLKTGKPYRR